MENEIKAEVKIFCEGEEVTSHYFEDADAGWVFFETYPVDDTADHIELWGFDSFEDWELLDERNEEPSY